MMFHLASRTWKGVVCGALATAFFASFYIAGRMLFGQYDQAVDPVVFTALRFLGAAVFFVALVLIQKKTGLLRQALRQDAVTFLGLALSGFVGEGLLLMLSLKYTTASRSCLFANASPILTVILAWAMVREPMGRRKVLGMLTGFLGVGAAIFSREGGDQFMRQASVWGDLLALLSAGCWAFYTVLGRNVIGRYGGVVTGTAAMIPGTVMLLALSLFFPWPWALFADPVFWVFILYTGVAACGVAYILWMKALAYLEAGQLGAFGYISVLMTMGASLWILKEKMDGMFVGGAVLVFLGVCWMMKEPPCNNRNTL